jgi:hypothetical protein
VPAQAGGTGLRFFPSRCHFSGNLLSSSAGGARQRWDSFPQASSFVQIWVAALSRRVRAEGKGLTANILNLDSFVVIIVKGANLDEVG